MAGELRQESKVYIAARETPQNEMFPFVARLISALSIALLLAAASAHAQSLDTLPLDQKLRLAKAGDEEAQIAIARAYESGVEVPLDEAQAAIWYRKAADRGNPVAMFGLARIISKGAPGLEKSPEFAANLYEAAARQGHVEAQNWLGYCYQHGFGIQQSDASAVAWYTRAATRGLAAAQNNLGLMYLTGKGVQRDYGRASELFEQAAKSGDVWGANNLGGMYERGWGVKQDWQKALAYYNQASRKGNKHASQSFRRLSAALGPSVTAAIIASSASEFEAVETVAPENAATANNDFRSAPPLLQNSVPNIDRAAASRPKKARKTKSRSTKKQAPWGMSQPRTARNRSYDTSRRRQTCSESFLEALFGGRRLCD
jgi:TPR repeat protein